MAELSGNVFWREPFAILCEPKQLVEFVVMDIEMVAGNDRRHVAGSAQLSTKVTIIYPIYTYSDLIINLYNGPTYMYLCCFQHILADVWVVKASEVGLNEGHTHCKTHLGHLLSVGDSVLGFV